jgi:hypothetical protein
MMREQPANEFDGRSGNALGVRLEFLWYKYAERTCSGLKGMVECKQEREGQSVGSQSHDVRSCAHVPQLHRSCREARLSLC